MDLKYMDMAIEEARKAFGKTMQTRLSLENFIHSH